MNFKFSNFQFLNIKNLDFISNLKFQINNSLKISFVLFAFLIIAKFTYAIDRPNNKFGIHLAQPDFRDIKAAADLVNSNGGKWGYITLVLQENDRDRHKWQSIFDYLRELHLIPIIRLATKPVGDVWRKPDIADIKDWVSFLISLNWVVKNRYVILFNEPNHASEWGGRVDPDDYRELALAFTKELKNKNPNFVVMLAGFDTAAPSLMPQYEDEEKFLKKIFNNETIKQWDDLLSGWVSHSYPADYVGAPNGQGRKSIRTYDWELGLLKNLGITKNLPVLITETGWEHDKLSEEIVANYLKSAYEEIWLKDDKVMAVTPFILNYQSEPFDSFSWRLLGEGDFYPQYYTIQALNKIDADPEIVENGEIIFDLPRELVKGSSYHFQITLKNTGSAIWDRDDKYSLKLNTGDGYFFQDIKNIKPNNEDTLDFYFKTSQDIVEKKAKISLYKKNKEVLSAVWPFKVLPLPKLKFIIDLYPKPRIDTEDLEIQIFDEKEQIIYKKKKIKVKNMIGFIDGIPNVSYDRRYRVVFLKPYYLPRQQYVIFSKGENRFRIEMNYPVDFDLNGKFDWGDLWVLIKNLKLLNLYRP